MKILLLFVALTLLGCGVHSPHSGRLKKMNASFEKFDIEAYEKHRNASIQEDENLNDFKRLDGTEIFRYSTTDSYEEEVVLPKPSFLKIRRTFYASGFIKAKGYAFGDLDMGSYGIKVGNWYYFDELGTLVKTVDEDQKFGKIGYKEILALLHEQGLIDIKSGNNRKEFSAFFERLDDGKGVWTVEAITDYLAGSYAKGVGFTIDSDSGTVLKQLKIDRTYIE